MTAIVPVTVIARDEERSIGPCLDALLASCRRAEARLPLRFDVWVVLDDCTDATGSIAARREGVTCVRSTGGKVAGQRRGARPGPFQIFSDADVRPDEDAILGVAEVMLASPEVLVAFPRLRPLPPRRATPLAWALHVYNRRRGFSSQRTWFNGKLFAIRRLAFPSDDEVRARARLLRPSRFYDFASGLRVDDVYLSRAVVNEGGPGALREAARGSVGFRAPETWRGMYRYYRRMRREIERTDALFPETREVHRQFGVRRADLLASAPLSERAAHALFQAALLGCRAGYRIERALRDHVLAAPWDPWPSIAETKEP